MSNSSTRQASAHPLLEIKPVSAIRSRVRAGEAERHDTGCQHQRDGHGKSAEPPLAPFHLPHPVRSRAPLVAFFFVQYHPGLSCIPQRFLTEKKDGKVTKV